MIKHRIRIFYLLFCSFFLTMFLSYYWVFNLSINNVLEYRQGLNDGSNRMRFVANIKTYELLATGEYLFFGFGKDIKESMEINDNVSYMGVRLVQSHNSINNLLLRMGIIPGCIYIYLISKFIDKKFSLNNVEYIFPYLISSMFMHSMYSYVFLVFWFLILALPSKKGFWTKFKCLKLRI